METQPGPGRLARLHRARLDRARCSSTSQAEPTATTGSTRSARRSTSAPTSVRDPVNLWGVPADPIHDPERFACRCPAQRLYRDLQPRLSAGPRASSARHSPNRRPAGAVPAEPDDLRRAAHSRRWTSNTTTAFNADADSACPGDDRLRPAQLQPEPHGEADDDRGRHGVRPGHRPQGAADAEPDDAVAVGDPHDEVTLPAGLHDQPERGRRQGRLRRRRTAIGTHGRATCPEFSKIGTADDRQLGAAGPIPGAIYLGEPQPGEPYRVVLTADGFGDPRQARRLGRARPADRASSTVIFEDLPQSPLQRVQHALLRLRARAARDPDPVRHLPGRDRLRALGLGAAEPGRRPVLHDRLGPERTPCPAPGRGRSPRARRRARANTTAGHARPVQPRR